MSTQIILKVLSLRHRLRQRDRWTRRQLEDHQARTLHRLREHTYARSPFYGRFHRGLADRPLNELPVLTKETVMDHFDKLVTDPTVRLADIEDHLATLSGGDELFNRRYRVASTSGSTGRQGLFLWDPGEWATVLASYNRSFGWAGVGAGLTHRTKMAVVSSTTARHQSARVGASVHRPTPGSTWRTRPRSASGCGPREPSKLNCPRQPGRVLMEEQNVGAVEQGVRMVAGSLASLSGIVLLVSGKASLASGTLGIVLPIAGLYLFVTESTGYCPVYRRLGWDTRHVQGKRDGCARKPKVVVSPGWRKPAALADAPLVPIHNGGHRMDSARGMGLVMRPGRSNLCGGRR